MAEIWSTLPARSVNADWISLPSVLQTSIEED